MGIISTLSDTLSGVAAGDADTADATADDGTGEPSQGAYWCDDCDVRVRNIAVEEQGLDRDADGTPMCPDCAETMRFERSHADACAC